MALTALILAGLTVLAFLLGIYLRPGASVFVLLPATLFFGLIAFVFALASRHSFGWALAVALFPANACQVGYAIGGLARSQETRAKRSTFGNDRSGGFTNDRVDALDGECDPPPSAPSPATMP